MPMSHLFKVQNLWLDQAQLSPSMASYLLSWEGTVKSSHSIFILFILFPFLFSPHWVEKKSVVKACISCPVKSVPCYFFFVYLSPHRSAPQSALREIVIDEEEFFDPKFDFDFTDLKDTEKYYRGGEVYERPCGWKRYALKVNLTTLYMQSSFILDFSRSFLSVIQTDWTEKKLLNRPSCFDQQTIWLSVFTYKK